METLMHGSAKVGAGGLFLAVVRFLPSKSVSDFYFRCLLVQPIFICYPRMRASSFPFPVGII